MFTTDLGKGWFAQYWKQQPGIKGQWIFWHKQKYKHPELDGTASTLEEVRRQIAFLEIETGIQNE